MVYNATYTGDDLGSITVDTVGKIAVAVGGLATIIGLVLAYGWFKKRVK